MDWANDLVKAAGSWWTNVVPNRGKWWSLGEVYIQQRKSYNWYDDDDDADGYDDPEFQEFNGVCKTITGFKRGVDGLSTIILQFTLL